MFCHNCGKKLPDDSVYCPACGSRLTDREQGFDRGSGSRPQPQPYPQPGSQSAAQPGLGSQPYSQPGSQAYSQPYSRPDSQSYSQSGSGSQPHPQQQSPARKPLSPKEREKRKKRMTIIAVVVAAALGVCLLVVFLTMFAKPVINLNEYLEVSFEGYNTVGTAHTQFDEERFERDYGKKLRAYIERNSSKIKQYLDQSGLGSAIYDFYQSMISESNVSDAFWNDCVRGGLDRSDSLSNGDIVTYEWNCYDEFALNIYGCKLKYEDAAYTVEGLQEASTFDPFEGIEVVFEGVAPNGYANVTGKADNSAAQNLSYRLDKQDGLSNGDTVTLTAYTSYGDTVEQCITQFGLIPSPLEKTYTVEGLDSYIRSLNDVSAESLKKMEEQAEDIYQAYVARDWDEEEGEKLKSLTYIGSYLLTNKNTDEFGGVDNALYLIYKVQINNYYSNDDGETYNEVNDIYWYTMYSDLLVDPDGVTTVDLSEYDTPNHRVTIDSRVDSGWWSTKAWEYYGYSSLDDLYREVVTAQLAAYNHEEHIDESAVPQVTAEAPIEEKAEEEGMIFPKSSEEKLQEEELKERSAEDLRYAINEIYARHGYIFNDQELKAHYEQYDWYHPSVKAEDFSTEVFNDVEKYNIELLQKVRDSKS